MDLNHIFLFIAIVSPLAVLIRKWRPDPTSRDWRIAAVVVLAVTGLAWIFFRKEAGYIGGGAWLAFLFLPAIGLRRMSELFVMQHYKSARRLAALIRWLHPSAEVRHQVQILRRFESRQAAGLTSPPLPLHRENRSGVQFRALRYAPAVVAVIVLNLLGFLIELRAGSPTAGDVLHRLGALEPELVIRGQYWRIITALFLHGGYIHLFFNLFALYVLGPPLERAIGTFRFLTCYLVSGIGSGLGVVALSAIGIINEAQLIGASGSIMGIVGAWAGYLLGHRHIPMARRQLQNTLIIVIFQTAFDLATPQISMPAHLCGLVTGFIAGLIVSPRIQGAAASRPPN